jgi:hypothetical protein
VTPIRESDCHCDQHPAPNTAALGRLTGPIQDDHVPFSHLSNPAWILEEQPTAADWVSTRTPGVRWQTLKPQRQAFPFESQEIAPTVSCIGIPAPGSSVLGRKVWITKHFLPMLPFRDATGSNQRYGSHVEMSFEAAKVRAPCETSVLHFGEHDPRL